MSWDITNYNTTPSSNTAINGINIAELCNASNINDAIRQMMADLAAHLASTNTWASKQTFTGGAAFGDANFYNQIQSGNPIVGFDTNDYMVYDRTNNLFQIFIGAVEVLRIGPTGIVTSIVTIQDTTYTFAVSDALNVIYHTGSTPHQYNIALNAAVPITVGKWIDIENGGAAVTLNPNSGVTLVWTGSGAVGARTLNQWSRVKIRQVQTDLWTIDGSGIS